MIHFGYLTAFVGWCIDPKNVSHGRMSSGRMTSAAPQEKCGSDDTGFKLRLLLLDLTTQFSRRRKASLIWQLLSFQRGARQACGRQPATQSWILRKEICCKDLQLIGESQCWVRAVVKCGLFCSLPHLFSTVLQVRSPLHLTFFIPSRICFHLFATVTFVSTA